MTLCQDARPDVVFYAPSKRGGLYEHTRYQAAALSKLGYNVHVLANKCVKDSSEYKVIRRFTDSVPASTKLVKSWNGLAKIENNLRSTVDYCRSIKTPILFLESFFEYGAPLWSRKLTKLAASGVTIGANLHDPVRDYRIGPKWWHQLSIRCAYSCITFALAHQTIPLNALVPKSIEVSVVPVGVYQPSSPKIPRDEARKRLALPRNVRVFLFFGFIRDNKNLDLAIRALASVPDAILVVAGSSQSSGNRPTQFYQDLAVKIGVSDRVRFDTEYISDEKIGEYFSACDIVLLTYSRDFCSQSGVLNIAAHYQKPCIASAGPSPLLECVNKFRLGKIALPDDLPSLIESLGTPTVDQQPDWQSYEQFATWETNVAPIAKRIDLVRKKHATTF